MMEIFCYVLNSNLWRIIQTNWNIGHCAIHIVYDMAHFRRLIVLFWCLSSRGILFVDGQIFNLWILYVIIHDGPRNIFLEF